MSLRPLVSFAFLALAAAAGAGTAAPFQASLPGAITAAGRPPAAASTTGAAAIPAMEAARAAQAPRAAATPATQPPPGLFKELRWRMIGPFRGGRTKAASGVPRQPNVFYVGAVNGGVWKTDDFGRTWRPIFDDQPTGSIGAIAVAPSDPNVIYVGSGEGLQRPDLSTGDGIYKSTDAGKTWTHLGLRDGQQIPQIAIDPRDPNRLFVAVLGHPYGPNDERGLFRSTDGGRTFDRVLFKDANSGAADVVIDPKTPDTIYAVLWQARQGPWENAQFSGPGSGLFKSTDGGSTWKPLTNGLPTYGQGLGRIGIAVAPSAPSRLFATVQVGEEGWLFRSDDAGESWRQISDDRRVATRPDDFAEVKVDPTNPDIVYTASIVTWKSVDGGRTFTAFRGAPGGDDYHRIWINPDLPRIILLASDQGAIVTVNGGVSWSSWYNQPTAQMFHATTDNAFPYRVCGGQQESGSACVASRGDDGEITMREWHPVGVEEYGYAAPDPLDPDVVFGGRVSRYDRRDGDVQNVGPRPIGGPDYHVVRTQPILFSPVDPHVLYFASNVLWKTVDGGRHWAAISPDLTRQGPTALPASIAAYANDRAAAGHHPGVIYTIAPSPLDISRIWIGTDDDLIQVTTDGGRTWADVTPPQLVPWAKVSLMDASHFDPLTAYAAINTFRLDDLRPHILRTRDGGKTWAEITAGIPPGGVINVVREDPVRRGLLFAGSEREVYASFDAGDHWQSLRLNMPATSIRDLVIKNADLVAATHGRGFWILDDISPLRQADAGSATNGPRLFVPETAVRVRWNKNTDTPLPPDEPAGENPPDGALIHYYLDAASPVVLEILDGAGTVVRRYSSADEPEVPVPGRNIPDYWIRPPARLASEPGLHRFVWDLHYPPPAGATFSYPIAAIYRNTPRVPQGPWVVPGTYSVRLTVGTRTLTQPLKVVMDPRVKTDAAGLQAQFTAASALADLLSRLAALGPDATRRGAGSDAGRLRRQVQALYDLVTESDRPPTPQALDALSQLKAAVAKLTPSVGS